MIWYEYDNRILIFDWYLFAGYDPATNNNKNNVIYCVRK